MKVSVEIPDGEKMLVREVRPIYRGEASTSSLCLVLEKPTHGLPDTKFHPYDNIYIRKENTDRYAVLNSKIHLGIRECVVCGKNIPKHPAPPKESLALPCEMGEICLSCAKRIYFEYTNARKALGTDIAG
jgi:hypothetical protein